ncbi:hypothetical protein [Paradevosia shaoguanensis]|uniref:Uncharacterized protein n=1 Tax=Paradevosia shaoguanensis TaxID=1335043 RepID=A0AA41QSK6_9HYPH|nr:hypothetical protein [Paradevosia shaoguanensis]MCF1744751.1 hypothetical protein [Paradevosia shaoguanensis]MCI0129234.1 hypothetical protein [Paradevosia shaoguanensis]
MMHDRIVDGEAMAAVEGVDVTRLLGSAVVIDMQQEPQRAAFNAYRVAFNANAATPNLRHAVALVDAWNVLADAVGLDRV